MDIRQENIIKFYLTLEFEMYQVKLRTDHRMYLTCKEKGVELVNGLEPEWHKADDGHMYRTYTVILNDKETVIEPAHKNHYNTILDYGKQSKELYEHIPQGYDHE